MFLGKVSCLMPDVTKANKDLFKEWCVELDSGKKACYKRCF